MARYAFSLIALAALVLPAPSAQAGEAYYLRMFGSQRSPNNPDYSHTWATFVHATWPGDCPPQGPVQVTALTISWLPANGIVRTWALLPECGAPWGLHETIRRVQGNDE